MGTLLMVVALVVFASISVAWLLRSFRGIDGMLGGLTLLLGGLRGASWPTGVQEDDPETAWATHRERPAGTTRSTGAVAAAAAAARLTAADLADPWAVDDDGEPVFTSTIELLD